MEKKQTPTNRPDRWTLDYSKNIEHDYCKTCGDVTWVTVYTYVELFTRKTKHKRERSTCSCYR